MLERAVATGRAPALAALHRARRATSTTASSAFPSVTPVCAAAIATGARPGRAPHPVDELVPPRRGALRRVRLVASSATRALRRRPLAQRHGLQHEPRAPRRATRRRCSSARRRRRAHRRHDLPDLPRPPPPRAVGDDRAHAASPRRLSSATPVYGAARALLRRPLRLARHRLPLAARHARACATSTPAAWAPTWSSTTCSTSCCSRCPTTTPTRTSTGPTRQVALDRARPTAQLERIDARGRRAGRVPRGARGDRHVRPLADRGRATRSTSPTRFDDWRVLAPGRPGADRGRDRGLPGRALGDGLRARRRARRDELVPRVGGRALESSRASTS